MHSLLTLDVCTHHVVGTAYPDPVPKFIPNLIPGFCTDYWWNLGNETDIFKNDDE